MRRSLWSYQLVFAAVLSALAGAPGPAPAAGPAAGALQVQRADDQNAAPADPVAWTAPATLPPLHATLSDADYQKARAGYAADVDLAALAHPKNVPGVRLINVLPNTQAARFGLHAGDRITAIDGQPVNNSNEFARQRKNWRVQTLTVVPAQGTTRQVRIGAGLIGIQYVPATPFDPCAAYLQSTYHDPRWDLDLVLAYRHSDDADFATAALAHAQAAGCKAPLLWQIAGLLAEHSARFDDALAYDQEALQHALGQERDSVADAMLATALSDEKIDLARDLTRRFPDVTNPAVNEQVAAWESTLRSVRGKARLTPAAAAAHLPVQDLWSHLKNLSTDAPGKWLGDKLVNFAALDFTVPTAYFQRASFGPAAHDCELALTLNFTDSDKGTSDFTKCVMLELDPENSDEDHYDFCLTQGAVRLWHDDYQVWTGLNHQLADFSKPRAVRLITIGPDTELLIDGHPVLRCPAPRDTPDRKLNFSIQVVGVKGHIDDLAWKTFDTKPAAPSAQPAPH